MICDPCKEGGKYNAEWVKLGMPATRSGDLENYRVWPELIRSCHFKCMAIGRDKTWCDCQHLIGLVLNYERIDQEVVESEIS